MKKNYFERVQEQTATRFWINNVTREQAKKAIEAGAVGCTQNPAYSWKMICNETEKDYVEQNIKKILKAELDDNIALVSLQRELVGGIAKFFLPQYNLSKGKQGFVSIQGDPFNEDTETIVKYARFNRLAGENIMAKIPATENGLKAIEILAKENVPINATECMAVRQVMDVCEVYSKATENITRPAPLYYSVITGIFDEHISNVVKKDKIDISTDHVWQAGLIVAKKAYEMVKQRNYNCHFIGGGARGIHHFTEMVGADCAITINWNGAADVLIDSDPPVVSRFFNPPQYSVIDELIEKIPDYRKAYLTHAIQPEEYEEYGPVILFRSQFESAWKNALMYIKSCR